MFTVNKCVYIRKLGGNMIKERQMVQIPKDSEVFKYLFESNNHKKGITAIHAKIHAKVYYQFKHDFNPLSYG